MVYLAIGDVSLRAFSLNEEYWVFWAAAFDLQLMFSQAFCIRKNPDMALTLYLRMFVIPNVWWVTWCADNGVIFPLSSSLLHTSLRHLHARVSNFPCIHLQWLGYLRRSSIVVFLIIVLIGGMENCVELRVPTTFK